MVFYKCLRCGYNTINKTKFKKHLNRKFICKPILKELPISDIYEHYKIGEARKRTEMSYLCHTYVNPSVIPQGLHCCNYCNKTFKSRQGKHKHIKSHCKKKDKMIKNKQLLEQNELLRKQMEDMKVEMSKIKNQITIKNNSDNTTNNTTNNIQINNFGREDIGYITNKMKLDYLKMPSLALSNIIKDTHFHPKHPENHNVRLTNIHDKYGKILKNNEWILINKADLIDNIVEAGKYDIEELRDEDELDNFLLKKFSILENIYNNNINKIYEKVKVMLLNETKKLLNKKDIIV